MSDKLFRCFGNQPGQELYAYYHDHEWGVPVHDDRQLFEMLILEGAQAGLSWETVLKKRASYREVFYNFDVQQIARMRDEELDACCQDKRLIRNRLKIYATRKNARIYQAIQQEFGSFDAYVWRFVEGRPLINAWKDRQDVPVTTPLSATLSQDLKKRGMTFVGATIMYAYMQAIGMVNDHLVKCHCYEKLAT